jgi:hypothetical protein
MEKTILAYPLVVTGEEKEVNPKNQKSWHGETLTLCKNLLKMMDPYFLLMICQRGKEGEQRWWRSGMAAGAPLAV